MRQRQTGWTDKETMWTDRYGQRCMHMQGTDMDREGADRQIQPETDMERDGQRSMDDNQGHTWTDGYGQRQTWRRMDR